MSFIRRLTNTAALAFLVSVTACTDALTGLTSKGLDEEQSMELFFELMNAGSQAFAASFNTAPASRPDGLLASRAPTETISLNAPCQGGGSIDLRGTVTDNVNSQGTGSLRIDLVQTPSGCRVPTSFGQITMGGDPNLSLSMNYTLRNWGFAGNATATMRGGIRYSGAESGSCKIDLSYSINPTSGSVSVNGTICGHSISESF